jgi:hypothetical protein
MAGDIRELNILNHYIGMPPLEAPALETSLFPIGIGTLVVLCLLSPLHRWLRRIAAVAAALTPIAILGDLQWRLYVFGHTLNPKAPIRLKPFTPLVIGETEMGNFESWAMVSWGFWYLVLAAVLLAFTGTLLRRFDDSAATRRSRLRSCSGDCSPGASGLVRRPHFGRSAGFAASTRRRAARKHRDRPRRTVRGSDRDSRTPRRARA